VIPSTGARQGRGSPWAGGALGGRARSERGAQAADRSVIEGHTGDARGVLQRWYEAISASATGSSPGEPVAWRGRGGRAGFAGRVLSAGAAPADGARPGRRSPPFG
jgi:hypothetical protein